MKQTHRMMMMGWMGAAMLFSGCAVWQQNVTPAPCERPKVVKDDLTGKPTTGNNPGTDTPITRPDLTNAKQERGKFAALYFAYDSADIKGNERAKLDAVIKHLNETPTDTVIIEGHCDERGTAEYNRTLGERRALAARKELLGRGIDSKRITTISYGKDKPVDTGSTDAAHAKNRRDEFVLVHP